MNIDISKHSISSILESLKVGYAKLVMTVLLCLSGLLLSQFSYAEQLSFDKTIKTDETTFNYEWKKDRNVYRLQFSLNNEVIQDMPNSPPRYSQQIILNVLYSKVMAKAKTIDPRVAKIDIRKKAQGITFNVSSRSTQQAQIILDELKEAHDTAHKEYLADNFFIEHFSAAQGTNLRHDHAKYTQRSKLALRAIVDAIKDMQQNPYDTREFINILLSWVQSIPYSKLSDRVTSNGAGFNSPRDVLIENQGDCDSKSTLMASVLKAYNDNIDVQMIYLPNHALIAVDIPASRNEQTIALGSNSYVLIEPTGPAQYNIGELGDDSLMALRNQRFEVSAL